MTASPYTVLTVRKLTVRRKRRRAPDELLIRHRVPVMLETVQEQDFPLAIRVIGDRRVEYRSHRHRIFAPERLRGMRSYPLFPVEFIASAFDGRLPPEHWHNPFLGGINRETLVEIPDGSELPVDVREVIKDPRDASERNVARLADRYVIFDGHLWKESPEPAYAVVKSASGGRTVIVDFSVEDAAGKTMMDEHMRFRLDRLADADRFAARLLGADAVEIKNNVAHLDAALLVRNDRVKTAQSLGAAALRSLEPWLTLLETAETCDWADLRDLIQRKSEDADAIGILSGRLLEALRRLPLNEHGRQVAERRAASLSPALIRWTEFEGGLLAPPLDQDDLDKLGDIGGGL